jgi:hypothetical protein
VQTPSFIPADAWPPNSPDMNPLDYHVWAELKERVYAGRSDAFGSLEELEAAAKEAWHEIPMENIRKSIARFRGRVELVATHDGGPNQHRPLRPPASTARLAAPAARPVNCGCDRCLFQMLYLCCFEDRKLILCSKWR